MGCVAFLCRFECRVDYLAPCYGLFVRLLARHSTAHLCHPIPVCRWEMVAPALGLVLALPPVPAWAAVGTETCLSVLCHPFDLAT